ncbi:MAG: hypothetical protein Q9187_009013, partial [Circinaria calcarea]
MPERVHHRFDDGVHPVNELTFTSAPTPRAASFAVEKASKKRKRERPEIISSIGYSGVKQPAPNPDTRSPLPLGESKGADSVPPTAQHRVDEVVNQPTRPTLERKLKSTTAHSNRSTLLSAKPGPSHIHASLKAKANALDGLRKALPIWSHAEQIRQGLRSKDVVLLVGETGSGKSTQVPQFLVDEPWCRLQSVELSEASNIVKVNVGGCIAITEPRRVAAITLARRVAEEIGTPLGSSSPASKVGYSVRFDNSTSPSTRIKFLTEGMLLQEMLRDPWLREYSAVVVDEVHERGVNVDL